MGWTLFIRDNSGAANLLSWSSHKSKTVARSALAAETFALAAGVDEAIIIKDDISKMLNKNIPLAVIIDSETLFNLFTGASDHTEKRLLTEIRSARENIADQTINEFGWCKPNYMVADAMTKINPNDALEQFLNTNELKPSIENLIERENSKTKSVFDNLSSTKSPRM